MLREQIFQSGDKLHIGSPREETAENCDSASFAFRPAGVAVTPASLLATVCCAEDDCGPIFRIAGHTDGYETQSRMLNIVLVFMIDSPFLVTVQ